MEVEKANGIRQKVGHISQMLCNDDLPICFENPMELYWAAQFALEFRQRFGRDIVLEW